MITVAIDFERTKNWHAGSWLDFVKAEAIARGFDWQVTDMASAMIRMTVVIRYARSKSLPPEKLFLYFLWLLDGLVPKSKIQRLEFLSSGLGPYFGYKAGKKVTKSPEQTKAELEARLRKMEQSKKRLVKWTKEQLEK